MNNKRIKIYSFALLVVLILAGLLLPLHFFITKSKLESDIKFLFDEGKLTSPQNFAAKYYTLNSKSEECVKIMKEVCAILENKRPNNLKYLIALGEARIPWLDIKLSPKLLATAQKYMEKEQNLFCKIEKLKNYPCLFYTYKWDESFLIETPRTGVILGIVKFCAIKIELSINQKKTRQTIKLLELMFHICNLMSQNYKASSQFGFYSAERLALREFERCINNMNLSSEQLKSFIGIFEEHEQLLLSSWSRIWEWELAYILPLDNLCELKNIRCFQNSFLLSKPEKDKLELKLAILYYSGISFSDLIVELKAVTEMRNMPISVYFKRIQYLKDIEQKLSTRSIPRQISASGVNVYSGLLEVLAKLRCAKVACAIERFRLKYRQLPKKLEELVPEFMKKIPVDPFDGGNIKYFHGDFKVKIACFSNSKQEGYYLLKYKVFEKSGFYVYCVGKEKVNNKRFILTRGVDGETNDLNFIRVIHPVVSKNSIQKIDKGKTDNLNGKK